MKLQKWFVGALAAAVLALCPIVMSAQSGVAAADAAAFLGSWTLTLESPQGAFEQTINIKDAGGKLAASISNQMQPEPTDVTDISKSETDLVLRFAGDFQGQAFTAAITMTPDGDNKARVSFDVMDGMFVMQGTGVKK